MNENLYEPATGMYRILSIGIKRSGQDSGEIDYSINVGMVDRLVESGRTQELLNTLEAVKQSATIQDAIVKDKLLHDLGAN